MPDTTHFWHPVLAERDLGNKPVAVTVSGHRYVLWRNHAGVPCALPDACPHREAPLSRGKVTADGRIACAFHGWSYDGDGKGHCPSQPKLKVQANALQVATHHGYLWMARRTTPRTALPALAWDGFSLAGSFTMGFAAPIHIMLDNFTEDEHFPYVHAAFGWTPDDWDKVEYDAKSHADHTEALYVGPQRRSPIITALGAREGDRFVNHFDTRFDPLHTTYTSHWEDPVTRARRPVEAKTVVFMIPESPTTTRFHTFLFLRLMPGSLHARMRPVFERIALEFVRAEWWMDGRWTRHLADTAKDLKGLRLGKYDKTVIRNRKLLDTIYFARESTPHGADPGHVAAG